MTAPLSRALMAVAAACMGERRRDWAMAMQAEFETAADEGNALAFAAGCLAAAWREMLVREEGHFLLTSYALALGLMIPMATLQIGSALLGFPYLYPPGDGLPVPLIEGGGHHHALRNVYMGVPSFALLMLILGVGHLRLAWVMLERDWSRALRVAIAMFAAVATLVLVMSAFFLDSSRVLLHGGVLAIELATVAMVARWHAQFTPAPVTEHSG